MRSARRRSARGMKAVVERMAERSVSSRVGGTFRCATRVAASTWKRMLAGGTADPRNEGGGG